MDKTKFENLLNSVRLLIEHNYKIEKIKGERFNVFSILKMEKLENRTHSAFIGELLNPKGTHLKGNLFTQLFLKTLDDKSLDVDTVRLKLEHHIGKRDNINKEGGRIDIFLTDNKGNSISIENKIDAGDQEFQIERYVNYHKDNNKVYYLTRFGSVPSNKSKGDLKEGVDYYLISYQNHILKWLELCLKESVDEPILRETIKQYIILIKKITNTMDEKDDKQLIDLILNNYEQSSFIANNFNKAKQSILRNIRDEVYSKLKERLGDKYKIEKGSDVSSQFSQLWIKPLSIKDSPLYFGVESFSGRGHYNGNLFIGVFNTKTSSETGYAKIKDNKKFLNCWINIIQFEDYEGYKMSLNSPKIISNCHLDTKFRQGLVNHIVVQIETYLESQTPPLIEYIKSKK